MALPLGTALVDPPFDYRDDMSEDDLIWQVKNCTARMAWHEITYWVDILQARAKRARNGSHS